MLQLTVLGCARVTWQDCLVLGMFVVSQTILPDAALRKILKEKSIFLRISDYSAAIRYEERLGALKETLDAEGIPYYINKSLTWLDFGFPDKPLRLPDDKVYQHMIEYSLIEIGRASCRERV